MRQIPLCALYRAYCTPLYCYLMYSCVTNSTTSAFLFAAVFLFYFTNLSWKYLRFFVCHTVGNRSNACDLNLNNISIFKVARVLHTHSDTCRSSSHNDGSLFQSCTLRNERDNFRDMEKKITCICWLSNFVIDSGSKLETWAITQNLLMDDVSIRKACHIRYSHLKYLTFADTIAGPMGANLSKPLLKHHWGTPPA